jgi:hypothetical protein
MEVATLRKVPSAAAFISVLLLSAVAGAQLIYLAIANPINVPPDARTKPPTIAISSTAVNGNNVSINFRVNVGESATATFKQIVAVYYTADWNQNTIYVYSSGGLIFIPAPTEFSYNLNITAIPEGDRTITVYAGEYGYYEGGIGFFITGFSSINFTIDTTPPNITVLSMESIKHETSDVPLNFIANEPVSQISYVLDGQENVTIGGNTTLTGLTNGSHNLTVYAWDTAGNLGVSETITFDVKVPEPFPTTLVAAASVVIFVVMGMSLLVYFKKRRHAQMADKVQ